jgi:hypothetical protein
VRGGNVVSAIAQGGAYAVAALADGGIGQADGVEMVVVGLDPGDVDLDLDDVGVDSVDYGAKGLVEHWQGGRTGRHSSTIACSSVDCPTRNRR